MTALRAESHLLAGATPVPFAEPYRFFFPLGVAFGAIGAGLWPLHALGLGAYPGPIHRTLMMQGFEMSFVVGFLLTAMPAFTHGPRCHPLELGAAMAAMLGFGAAALTGAGSLAHLCFVLTLLLLLAAGLRRVAGNPLRPPEEFLFVGFGLGLGVAGGLLLAADAWAAALPLPPRFPDRLLSLGMVLSLVTGVGSLLVPTFAGLRDPLAIPGLARPHQRQGRRPLYAAVVLAFVLAFAAELGGQPRIGMGIRAAAATLMVTWVWKLYRMPRPDPPAYALWLSGWFVPLGLWGATVFPAHTIGALHVTFLGGFSLLTLGVGTRVVVTHGKQPLARERRMIDAAVMGPMAAALAARLAAEVDPRHAAPWLGASGVFWLAAWLLWLARALRLRSGG